MAVLTHLRDEDTRTTSGDVLELIGKGARLVQRGLVGELGGINARNRMDNRLIAAGYFLDSVGNLTQRAAHAGSLDGALQEVAVLAVFGGLRDSLQSGADVVLVALAAQLLETLHLRVAHGGVVDGQDFQRVFLVQTILVQADDRLVVGVDTSLTARSGFLDTHLRQARRNSFRHTAESLDFLDMRPSAANDLVGEGLDIVGAAPRIDDLADAGLVLDIELRIAGDTRGEVRRQRDSLVQRVRVQRLGVAESRAHSLHRRAGHVVERILRGERPTGRLAVGTQSHRLVVGAAHLLDDLRPEHASRAHLRDFHEVVLADSPEEGQTLRKGVDLQAGLDTGADILEAVGQRVAELDVRRSAGFLHMVAGNRDAVELRHIVRGVLENIADDAHGHIRRVNVRVANHELFQDIVLDRTGHDRLVHALLNTGLDEERKDRQHGAVHRHRNGHLIERNAAKQDVHIKHRADGNACLADVAEDARIVGVVTAMGRQVERDGKTFLTGGQIAAIECVGFLSGGETRVLANRPRTEHVHRRVRAAQAGRDTAGKIEMVHVVVLVMGVERANLDMLHRGVHDVVVLLAHFRLKLLLPCRFITGRRSVEGKLREIRILKRHQSIIPFFFCRNRRIW